MPLQRCKHCRRLINCPRLGLCWVCYQTTPVRRVYSRELRKGRRGVAHGKPPRGHAPWSTSARPGTREKIAVLAWRAAAGFELFHPQDASTDDDDDADVRIVAPVDTSRVPPFAKPLLASA